MYQGLDSGGSSEVAATLHDCVKNELDDVDRPTELPFSGHGLAPERPVDPKIKIDRQGSEQLKNIELRLRGDKHSSLGPL